MLLLKYILGVWLMGYQGTTCNVKLTGSGCCPKGKMCTSFATCYDHASSNCSNNASPEAGCCPVDTPYCRDFKPNGLGCYASSIMATPSSIVGLAATPMDAGLSTVALTRSGTATLTISAIWNSISVSLHFVTNTEPSHAATSVYVLEYPSGLGSAAASPMTVVPSDISSSITSTVRATSATASSALCHNDDSKTPVPCQGAPVSKITDSSASGAALTTSNIGYSPPGTSVYKSQASSSFNPFSMVFSVIKLSIFTVFKSLTLFFAGIALSLESGDFWSLEYADYLFMLAGLIPQLWCFFAFCRWMSRLLPATMSRNAADPGKPAANLPKSDIGQTLLLLIQQRIAYLNQSTQNSLIDLVDYLETLPPDAAIPKLQTMIQATLIRTQTAFIDINNLLFDHLNHQQEIRSIRIVHNSGRRLTSQSRLGREISAPVPSTLRPLKYRSIKAAKEDIHVPEGSERRFSQVVRENEAEMANPGIHEKEESDDMLLPEDEDEEAELEDDEAKVEDDEEKRESQTPPSPSTYYRTYGVTRDRLEDSYERIMVKLQRERWG